MPTVSPFCPSQPRVIKTEIHPSDHFPFGLLLFGDPVCVSSPADYSVRANCIQHGSWLRWAGPEKTSTQNSSPAGEEWKASPAASAAWSLPGFAASSCHVYRDLKIHFVLAFHMDLVVERRIFFKVTNLPGNSVFRILIA